MNKVSIAEENMPAKPPPQHRWYHDTTETGAEAIVITLWPYRSLSLRGFQIFIAVLASLMSLIGLGFYLLGAWPVIGFLGLEILVVWYAFKWNYRSGQLIETVAISPQQVDVTRTDWRGRTTTVRLNGAWIKAELDIKEKKRERLYLRQHARRLEIGAFMPPSEKPSLAKALNAALSRLRYEANRA